MSAHRGKILRVEGMAMPLSYRSFTRFTPKGVDYEHIVLEQFDKWLHDDPKANPRKFARDKLEMNSVIAYSPFADVVLVEKTERDGTRTIRARLSENKQERGQAELWISTLTLHLPGKVHDQGFFLFEMDSPLRTDHRGISRPVVPGNPGFIRRILDLEEIELFDGHYARLRTEPRLIEVEEVEFLIHAACDPQRRGALVVMGTDEQAPYSEQITRAKTLFGKLSGVATSYVLSAEATAEFNAQIGAPHAVHGGSIRTYYPEVDPASKLDAWRHPFVRREKIEELEGRIVTRMLESATRRLSLETSLPNGVQRIDTRMTLAQNEAIISGRRTFAYQISNPEVAEAIKPISEVGSADSSSTTNVSVAESAENYLVAVAKLKEVIPFEEFNLEVANTIVETISRINLISSKFDQISQEVQDLKSQLGTLNEDFYELEYDQWEDYESRRKADNQLHYFKNQLEILTSVGDIKEIKRRISALLYTDGSLLSDEDSAEQFIPTNFVELVLSLDRLPFLEFTGNESVIDDLDRRGKSGVNVGKTWSGLRMLNDYVRAKNDQIPVTHMKDYLERSPAGYFSDWSTDKYAANESDTVDQNPSMRSQRIFPVPAEVNAAKKVYMPSHLKIGSKLRVHFHQDLVITNRIYIGYIGRHLDNGSTN
jgi:hypothetical protein